MNNNNNNNGLKRTMDRLFVDNSVCKYCGPGFVIEQTADGHNVCTKCGVLVGDRLIDTASEWRTFQNDLGDVNDPSRVGDIQSIYGIPDLNVSVKLGTKSSDISIAKLAQSSNASAGSEKTLNKNLIELSKICDSMNLDFSIQDTARRYFKELVEMEGIKNNKKAYIAAVIYIVCKEKGVTRSFKEMAAFSGVDDKIIAKYFNDAKTRLKIQLKPMNSIDFVARFCNNLGLSQDIQKVVLYVMEQNNKVGVGGARQGPSVVAGAIYFVSQLMGGIISIKSITDVSAVTEATMKAAYSDMLIQKHLLLPKDFKPKVSLDNLS